MQAIKQQAKQSYIYYFLFLIVLAISTWGVNKGLDLSDEGSFILQYLEGQDSGISMVKTQKIIQPLIFWGDITILNIRIIRYFLTILSAIILYVGLKKWSNEIEEHPVFKPYYFVVIYLGVILTYTYRPQVFTYNLIYVFFAVIVGFILYRINNKSIYKYFLPGLFFPFLLYVKLPSAILFFGLTTLYLFFYPDGLSLKNKIYSYLFLILGSIIGLLIISLFYPFNQYLIDITQAVPDTLNNGTHGIKTHLNSLYLLFYTLIFHAAFASLVVFIYLFLLFFVKIIHQNKIAVKILPILLFLIFIFFLYFRFADFGQRRGAEVFVFLITIGIIYFIFIEISQLKKLTDITLTKKKVYISILYLAAIPVTGVLGTDDILIFNALTYIFFWFLILIIITIHSKKNIVQKILLFVSIISVLFYIKAFVFNPYRTEKLINHTEELNTSLVTKGMKIDKKTKNFLHEIYYILKNNGFKEGDQIISPYAGIIAVVNGRQPGTVYWTQFKYKSLINGIKKSTIKIGNPYFIIKDKLNNHFIKELNAVGIPYPYKYKQIGTALDKRHNWKFNIYKYEPTSENKYSQDSIF